LWGDNSWADAPAHMAGVQPAILNGFRGHFRGHENFQIFPNHTSFLLALMTLLFPLMSKVVISMDFTNLRIEKWSFSIQVSLIYEIVSISQN
jgi:hypothetical protein